MTRDTIAVAPPICAGWPKGYRQDLREALLKMARDYDEIVEDIEAGGDEIRHQELLTPPRG